MKLLTFDELIDCDVYEFYPGEWRDDVPNMKVACRYYMTETRAVYVCGDGEEREWPLGIARAEVERMKYLESR